MKINVGAIAASIVVILVIVLIAVSLINPLFTSVYSAGTNVTLTKAYASAFDLVNLIPLIFGAGIIVLIVVLLFEHLTTE